MFVFFDIGDTLVDESEFGQLRQQKIYEFLIQRGIETDPDSYSMSLNNMSMRGRISLFEQLRMLSEETDSSPILAMELFRDYTLQVAPAAPLLFRPFPDAEECLDKVSRDFPRRLGVIANQPTWIRKSMEEWGLAKFFIPECFVISDEVGVNKPDPSIFEFALAQGGIPSHQAVMIGNDYLWDIEPAKRLGMHTIWIDGPDTYNPWAPPIENPSSADFRIHSLAEVPNALEAVAS